MELNDYVRILRAHWQGVLLIVLAALGATLAFSLMQTKVYAANANGFVSTGGDANPALASVSDSLAKSRAASYVDIAESRATARSVIADLGLKTTPESLIGRVEVEQPVDTVLIKITARGSSPREAQELADAWVAALAEQVASIEDPAGKDRAGTLKVIPVEAAQLPTSPVSPNLQRNLLLGLVLGLLVGFGYAVVRSLLDRRLRSVTDVEQKFGVNVMASIPASVDLQHEAGQRAELAVGEHPNSPAAHLSAEAFRKLRTNLRFMDVDNPPRTIVVTSPKPGDGKSTIAANLAGAIAVSGQPVVLVDGDLRRPTVAEVFGLVQEVGLTDALTGGLDVRDALQPAADIPNLSILASGAIPPNPSELLGSQSMRSLLATLAEEYTVIIDAPPLLPVTDAAVLTAVADGAFVVISAGRTLDSELAASLSHLDAVSGRALGVIMNRVAKGGPDTGYYRSDYYRSADGPRSDEASPGERGSHRRPAGSRS